MVFLGMIISRSSYACSVLSYINSTTGKIYVVNSEDNCLDVAAYTQIEPKSKNELTRLWDAWDNFAQGGIDENGFLNRKVVEWK